LSNQSIVIFTDLDGTLLDARRYTFEAAIPGLRKVREAGVPLVICTSKSQAEIQFWREQLDNRDPYILESGGGIVIPDGYFEPEWAESICPDRRRVDDGTLLVLGTPYADLRQALRELKTEGFAVRGVGDMTASEFAELTGLSLEQAEMAKDRHFDEPFVFSGGDAELESLKLSIREKGLRFSRGRLFHITGDNDKGRAVRLLERLYEKKLGELRTVGLGDSPLDFPMFEVVDQPVLVQNASGRHDSCPDLPGLYRVDRIGPEGWTKAIIEVLSGAG
jgi:mannosyl-3-phosphoglycerate phosphatase